MTLSDTKIRSAKPKTRAYKLSDEKGLYLLINPNGSKYWRQKYYFAGKENLLAHGVYPEVSLKDAREKRDQAKKLLANHIDPSEHNKAQKSARLGRAANSFEVVAREWLTKQTERLAPSHTNKIKARLETKVFPWLGNSPIAEISPFDILDKVLRRIEAQGTIETANRTKGTISQIMRYAVSTGRAERDPCPDLKNALSTPKTKNFASLTNPEDIAILLNRIANYRGTYTVYCALQLAPLVFVRPGELRQAEWKDIDLENATWSFIASKTGTPHIVPLAKQAVEILQALHPLTGHRRYVFNGRNDPNKPMSDGTINRALQKMGYDTQTEMTGHGFRAMARTILHERLDVDPHVIERQLAHAVPDTLGTAYNRTQFIEQRKIAMQIWADYLDQLKASNPA